MIHVIPGLSFSFSDRGEKKKHSSKSKRQGKDYVSCKSGNTKLKYDNETLLNQARLVNQALMQTKMDKAMQQQQK
jgi:hypothetical protein